MDVVAVVEYMPAMPHALASVLGNTCVPQFHSSPSGSQVLLELSFAKSDPRISTLGYGSLIFPNALIHAVLYLSA